MSKSHAIIINGWAIFLHPFFLNQFEELKQQVEILRQKDPIQYKEKNATKRLAAITKLAFHKIPLDPTLPEYRLEIKLGEKYKHWFRAKFFQQYGLFFRFHFESKIIVYAWVNDEDTKRAYNNKSDAYQVFKKMLSKGRPPNDWNALIKEAKNVAGHIKSSPP